ncbi:unnamed protein product, partial [Mesorhabditis belari]|uniref:Uncharacterized protein n=1 Tax=Mesorhabditis belari TaxID=2138241 RepID=A0AAF3J2S0_9BILA
MTILYGIDEPTQSPLVSDEEIRSIIRDEYGIVKEISLAYCRFLIKSGFFEGSNWIDSSQLLCHQDWNYNGKPPHRRIFSMQGQLILSLLMSAVYFTGYLLFSGEESAVRGRCSAFVNAMIKKTFFLCVSLSSSGGEEPYMQTAELANEHERCRSEAIREFRNAKKRGGAAHTAVLIAIMIADYVLQEFCQLLGMNSIAGIFSSVFFIIVCTLSDILTILGTGFGRSLFHQMPTIWVLCKTSLRGAATAFRKMPSETCKDVDAKNFKATGSFSAPSLNLDSTSEC